MSSAEDALTKYFSRITNDLNRYLSIFIYVFGGVGNIINVLILSQRSFRKNPCAFLFMAASVANFVVILAGLTSRVFSGWTTDLSNTTRFFCKLRGFTLNTSRPIGFWLILFAAIDRWLLSSRDACLRRLSSLKSAQRAALVLTILSTIHFSHVIYCQEPNQVNSPMLCYGFTIVCRFVTDASFVILGLFIPLTSMLIFGLMTIRNIRNSRSQIQPTGTSMMTTNVTNQQSQQAASRRKADHRLLLMLLVQVFLLVLFGSPLGFQKIYSILLFAENPMALEMAINNFVYALALLLNFVAYGMPFYIYTLVGGSLYRQALMRLLVCGRFNVCRAVGNAQ